jgi:putative colanic acid biosynthesis acetyltransferase WcaF
LGAIEIGEGAIVAQEVYLCAATHDFTTHALPLVAEPIRIGPRAFIGSRAFLLPGVSVGTRAIIGACSVVTHDIPENVVAAGNPAVVLKARSPSS